MQIISFSVLILDVVLGDGRNLWPPQPGLVDHVCSAVQQFIALAALKSDWLRKYLHKTCGREAQFVPSPPQPERCAFKREAGKPASVERHQQSTTTSI